MKATPLYDFEPYFLEVYYFASAQTFPFVMGREQSEKAEKWLFDIFEVSYVKVFRLCRLGYQKRESLKIAENGQTVKTLWENLAGQEEIDAAHKLRRLSEQKPTKIVSDDEFFESSPNPNRQGRIIEKRY